MDGSVRAACFCFLGKWCQRGDEGTTLQSPTATAPLKGSLLGQRLRALREARCGAEDLIRLPAAVTFPLAGEGFGRRDQAVNPRFYGNECEILTRIAPGGRMNMSE